MFSLREKIVQTDTILPSNNIFDSEIIHLKLTNSICWSVTTVNLIETFQWLKNFKLK